MATSALDEFARAAGDRTIKVYWEPIRNGCLQMPQNVWDSEKRWV